jgi:integrase
MGVQLREKQLSDGQISFYLDIYHNKKRWYEFLDIHINKKKPSPEDQEKRRLAKEIRAKRESDLIVLENGLIDKSKRKVDFIVWFEQYMKERELNNSHNRSTLSNLKKYLNGKPLPFAEITVDWLKLFIKHLLKRMNNNSARTYLINIQTALDQAVRDSIIMQNPFRMLARHEKVRIEPTFRQAYSLDDLQKLVETRCPFHPQYKQGYLFSCFTGLRWSDVNGLEWENVIVKNIDGQEEWFIYFGQQKTKGIEYLPLSDQAVEILKARKADAMRYDETSPHVFPIIVEHEKGSKSAWGKMDRRIKKWAKAAGLNPKQMHFHTGRHSFATNVLENSPDGDLWTVSKLLGHKSISATQIYAHVRDNKKKAAVKALPKLNIKLNAA